MANTSDIKNGLCINFNSDIYQIIEFLHVKPGKGSAFVRTKIKSLTSGKVLENIFPSGIKIDVVRVENRKYQYLYNDENGFHFMNTDNFEQTFISGKLIENNDLLKEGEILNIIFHADEERPLAVEMPMSVSLKIIYTEPGLKGDTATNTMKPATLETDAQVKVPLFCNEGDIVKIDSRSRNYIERIK